MTILGNGILGYEDIGQSGYWKRDIVYWDMEILGYEDIWISGYWDIGILGY